MIWLSAEARNVATVFSTILAVYTGARILGFPADRTANTMVLRFAVFAASLFSVGAFTDGENVLIACLTADFVGAQYHCPTPSLGSVQLTP